MATVQITRQHHEIAAHVLRVLAEQGESEARLVASEYMNALITDTRGALTVGKKDLNAVRKAMLLITGDELIDGKFLKCPIKKILRPYYVVSPYSLVLAPPEVVAYNKNYDARVETIMANTRAVNDDDVIALKLFCRGVLSQPFTPIRLNKLVRNDPNENSNKGEFLKYMFAIAICSGRRFWEELLFLSEFEPMLNDHTFLVHKLAKDFNKKDLIIELPSLFVDPKIWIQRLKEIKLVINLNNLRDATQASNSCAQYLHDTFKPWFSNVSRLISAPSDCRDMYANIYFRQAQIYGLEVNDEKPKNSEDRVKEKLIVCGEVLVHILMVVNEETKKDPKTPNGVVVGKTNASHSYMVYNLDRVSLGAIED
jgi:hypothetical protein